jgi:hypothetical protein
MFILILYILAHRLSFSLAFMRFLIHHSTGPEQADLFRFLPNLKIFLFDEQRLKALFSI